jgi:hypothetical protein
MSKLIDSLRSQLVATTSALDLLTHEPFIFPADAHRASQALDDAAVDIDNGVFFGSVELEPEIAAVTDAYRRAEQHLSNSYRSGMLYRSALAELDADTDGFGELVVFGFVGRPDSPALDAVLQHCCLTNTSDDLRTKGVVAAEAVIHAIASCAAGTVVTEARPALAPHQNRALGMFWNPWHTELKTFETAHQLASSL